MHPIEQLRFVARSSGIESSILVEEAASALGFFSSEPRALLTACRQLLTRQPAVGPLWWLCSRVILAEDQRSELRLVMQEFRSDTTPDLVASYQGEARVPGEARVLDEALRPDAGCLIVGVEVGGMSKDGRAGALLTSDSLRRIEAALGLKKPIWLAMGVGVWLPWLYWEEVLRRCGEREGLKYLDLGRVSGVIGPNGPQITAKLAPSTMALAPELLVGLT